MESIRTPVILTEKLRRPEVTGLSRSRLENRLLDEQAGRLDLVVAPPGSGKTTLLARVAARAAASGSAVAWYRITADDTAESTLVAHLERALRQCVQLRPTGGTMAALLGSLEGSPASDAMVILDDLHEIAGSAAERSLEQFIELRPRTMRVLVGSRRLPEMNIPRLRVSGMLHEITGDDLRFRSWEVEELFVEIFREPLSPESAAALTRRTGGWAAGLQLFHLSTAGRTAVDRQRAVADLGGRSKLVRSYLTRNVLAELPVERRQFLLHTCTLGSFTGALCDALLETSGSRAVLDDLEQQQLFTFSADDGETFSYHEVLRSHLEWTLVQQEGAVGARRWYSRSAALLESTGDERAAARAYARAEDWGAVARLLQTSGAAADGAASPDLLLPPSVVRHDPWLSLAQGRRLVRDGALAAASDAFRQAEDLLDEPDFRDSCRRERLVTWLWSSSGILGPGWAGAKHWSAAVRLATQRGRRDLLPADCSPAGVDVGSVAQTVSAATDTDEALSRGLALVLAGELTAARAVLSLVTQSAAADTPRRMVAQVASMVAEQITVGCEDPAARWGQLALDAELAGLPWLARISRGLGEAVLAVSGPAGSPGESAAAAQPDSAETSTWRLRAGAQIIVDCERAGDDWGAAVLAAAMAVAAHLVDPAADPADFADVATRFDSLDAPVPALWARALQVCLMGAAGTGDAAETARRVLAQARALQVDGAAVLAGMALDLTTRNPSASPMPGRLPATTAAGPAIRAILALVQPAVAGRPSTAPAREVVSGTQGGQLATAAAAGPLRIRCLGGFRIDVGGLAVDLDVLRPRARALLRLLALTPDQDRHREVLMDAMWPGVEVVVATRRLQVAVSSIRQVLEHAGLTGTEVLARHADAYRFSPPPGSMIDVRDFQNRLRDAARAAAAGDHPGAMAARQAALTLYRGDLLPEDGPAEYVVAERDRLRLSAATAATALAQDSRRWGHPRQALAAARQSVQLDRFQDLGWTLLVTLHEESGDRSAAALARRDHARARADLDLAVR